MMLAPATGLSVPGTTPEIPPGVTCAEVLAARESVHTASRKIVSQRRTGIPRFILLSPEIDNVIPLKAQTLRTGGNASMTMPRRRNKSNEADKDKGRTEKRVAARTYERILLRFSAARNLQSCR